jgi:hypothetical protein
MAISGRAGGRDFLQFLRMTWFEGAGPTTRHLRMIYLRPSITANLQSPSDRALSWQDALPTLHREACSCVCCFLQVSEAAISRGEYGLPDDWEEPGDFCRPLVPEVWHSFVELVRRCTHETPEQRPSCEEVIMELVAMREMELGAVQEALAAQQQLMEAQQQQGFAQQQQQQEVMYEQEEQQQQQAGMGQQYFPYAGGSALAGGTAGQMQGSPREGGTDIRGGSTYPMGGSTIPMATGLGHLLPPHMVPPPPIPGARAAAATAGGAIAGPAGAAPWGAGTPTAAGVGGGVAEILSAPPAHAPWVAEGAPHGYLAGDPLFSPFVMPPGYTPAAALGPPPAHPPHPAAGGSSGVVDAAIAAACSCCSNTSQN